MLSQLLTSTEISKRGFDVSVNLAVSAGTPVLYELMPGHQICLWMATLTVTKYFLCQQALTLTAGCSRVLKIFFKQSGHLLFYCSS